MYTLFIAKTQAKAREIMARTTVELSGPDDHVAAVGIYGSVHSTPDKIFMCEKDFPLNDKSWKWLTECVGIDRAWEVRWVLQ
jgi:hypothetical protein